MGSTQVIRDYYLRLGGYQLGDGEELVRKVSRGHSLADLIGTELEALNRYQEFKMQLDDRQFSGEMNPARAHELEAQALERLEGAVSTRDFYILETEDDVKEFFRALGLDERMASTFLNHERAHFEKAKELGYEPAYGVWFWKRMDLENGRTIPGFTPQVTTVNTTVEDMASISDTVEDAYKSPRDRNRLKSLGQLR